MPTCLGPLAFGQGLGEEEFAEGQTNYLWFALLVQRLRTGKIHGALKLDAPIHDILSRPIAHHVQGKGLQNSWSGHKGNPKYPQGLSPPSKFDAKADHIGRDPKQHDGAYHPLRSRDVGTKAPARP